VRSPARPRPFRVARVAALAVAAALALPALAACTGQDESRVSTVPVIEPGRPGETATVHTPGTSFAPIEDQWTAADAAFMVGMIPHHQQALDMAELAPDRAENAKVQALAARIADVQGAEMDVYRRWLSERGMAEDGSPDGKRQHGAHSGDDETAHLGADGHAGMKGMASAEDIERLTAARGSEFDRIWLELMIEHHAGALEMAHQRHTDGGMDTRADELAADVTAGQLAEIKRMQAIQGEL